MKKIINYNWVSDLWLKEVVYNQLWFSSEDEYIAWNIEIKESDIKKIMGWLSEYSKWRVFSIIWWFSCAEEIYKNVISKRKLNNDKDNISSLLELWNLYQNIDYNTSLEYYHKALKYSNNFQKWEIYYKLWVLSIKKWEYEKSTWYFKKWLEFWDRKISKLSNDAIKYSEHIYNIDDIEINPEGEEGISYDDLMNHYTSFSEIFSEMIINQTISEKDKIKELLSININNWKNNYKLWLIYIEEEKYNKALTYLLKSLPYLDKQDKWRCLLELWLIYKKDWKIEESIVYFNLAIKEWNNKIKSESHFRLWEIYRMI